MASVGHAIFGSFAARFVRPRGAFERLKIAVVFAGLALLPDADAVAFVFRIPYEHPFGHRGATHSLAFAVAIGIVASLLAARSSFDRRWTFIAVAAVVASHGLLDMLTDGGLGVALFWPFTSERYFFPWRPLPVAPIGAAFLSARGLHVALVEIAWFSPFILFAWWPKPR